MKSDKIKKISTVVALIIFLFPAVLIVMTSCTLREKSDNEVLMIDVDQGVDFYKRILIRLIQDDIAINENGRKHHFSDEVSVYYKEMLSDSKFFVVDINGDKKLDIGIMFPTNVLLTYYYDEDADTLSPALDSHIYTEILGNGQVMMASSSASSSATFYEVIDISGEPITTISFFKDYMGDVIIPNETKKPYFEYSINVEMRLPDGPDKLNTTSNRTDVTKEQWEMMKKPFDDLRENAPKPFNYEELMAIKSSPDITITSKYQNVNCIDSETYSKIERAYNKLNFNVSFNTGNIEEYSLYKKQFCRLLKNEAMFTEKETGEEFYLNEYGYFSIDVDLGRYDLNNYTYYLYDINGDESPELCISDNSRFTYVISYDIKSDLFTLWQRYETPYIYLLGTKKIGYSGNAKDAFFMLDEDGEYDCFIWFKTEGYRDLETQKDSCIFMVSLPQYVDQYNQEELTEHMREQAVYDENQDLYYFRVTEKQYNSLTRDYFKMVKSAKKAIKKVDFTYEKLSGNDVFE